CSALSGLVPTDGANPGFIADQMTAKRQNLAVVAALIRPDTVERSAMLGLVLGNRKFGTYELDLNSVPLLDALAELQGLRKLIAGLQVEDLNGRLDFSQHVDQAATFR